MNSQQPFLFNLQHFVNYLFHWEILPYLLIFSLLFVFMPLTLGLLQLLVLLMVYKMAFDVLADVASGHMTPTSRHNYLVGNAVGVKVAVLVLLIELGKKWLQASPTRAEYVQDFELLTTFITPAIYMSLAINNSLLKSINPLVLFQVIKIAYLSYFFFVLFWVATHYFSKNLLTPFAIAYLPSYIDGIIASFIEYSLLLINFQIMGYILYQNRDAYGLHEIAGFYTLMQPSLKAETETETTHNPFHQRIKTLLAQDDLQQAAAVVAALQQQGDDSHELKQLQHMLVQHQAKESNPQLVAYKIHTLIEKKQIKQAFDKVQQILDQQQTYVEHSAFDINPLLTQAQAANKTDYIPLLMKDFDQKYPQHMDSVANYFILAKLLYQQRENRSQCQKILENLLQNYPNDKHIGEVKQWYKGLLLLQKKSIDLLK